MAVRFRHRLEYAFFRSFEAVLNALPLWAAYAAAAAVAAIAYRLFPARPREARRRIAQVFPEKSPREIDRIARLSLRNLFFNAVELARAPTLDARWIERHVDYQSFVQTVQPHLTPGRGAIFVIPHMGNWDLTGIVGARRFRFPMFFIVGRQRNPLTDARLHRLRSATGLEFLYREDDNVRTILRNLKQGKIFGVVPDVRMPMPGIPVTLFGFPADLPAGPAVFARRANVPIIIGYARRVGWSRHVWHFEPPIFPDEERPADDEAKALTQRMADVFTRAVQAHPDQYFWYNRRWVLEPREG
ncbi:MAG: lysophospholipid acyltransferase family protein [Kiritimatiellae bacterium]|nr:lysophospholipid acyltransferase family protein [Kiritimatiellia bacterium]MDW8458256.1 lysophospholipid acyltransferase family protein [Verrucomicrobiota bacterium]